MSGILRIPVLAAFVVAVALALAPAPAGATQTEIFLEVRPNTIQAGFQIGLLASCGDSINPATVRSRAFGEVTLQQRRDLGLLAGSVTVPATTRPRGYRVELRCVDGGTASAELFVLDMARPTRGPDTGGGGSAGTAATLAPVLLAAGGTATLATGAGLWLARRRPG